MSRFLMAALAAVAAGGVAWAGGPPPVYVVVDRVELEPTATAPERIKIHGCFVRQGDANKYVFGKPTEGFVYLSVEPGKAEACRAEWAKWRAAAGTGKAVSVGSCGEAGSLMTAPIHKPGEAVDRPDAAYSTDFLGRFGALYADGDTAKQAPVRDLLTFAKDRADAGKKAERPARR